MIRIISYSSFFCKSTHLLFTTLRENQDIMFIHIKEITVREKRLSSMNSTTPFKKPTIKIPFLSMNFLKTWQPYRTVTYIALASKEVLFWNFKWIQECFHLLNWAYLPVLIYLRHSAQKINKEHVDQTSNNPQRSRTTNLCNNVETSSHYQVLVAQSSIEVQITSSQETPTSHLPTWGTLSFKHNLWFGTNFSKVNLLNSNTY